ncbi:MAG: DNA polymerase III subunit gamma/tau, partial [Planctomycetota bacterium]|nr:DNA polymerase III subunit gamma/tau [Planctomycetota bacterium]
MAKSLNCLEADKPTPKPCLKCSSCEAVHVGEDIDVIEIDGASNNKVEDVHELRGNAIYRPNRSRFKIYIIDEAHMLTPSAFNALLKTLEEPPEHVKFIFATTEPQKIPATILSRCQRYDFRTISQADIASHLKKIIKGEKLTAEPEALAQIARLAAGSMRDGLSILDQLLSANQKKLTSEQVEQTLGMPHFRQVLELVGALLANDISKALAGLDKLISLGHSLEQIVNVAIEHCRGLMLLLSCGDKTELVSASGDNRQALIKQTAELDVATIVFFISVLEELGRAMRFSSSARSLCEAGLVRLAGRENFISTEAIIGLLESGQAAPSRAAGSNPPFKKKPKVTQSQTANPAPRARPSKEALESSKNNPLVSKTVELFNGVIMDVSKNHDGGSSDT